MTKSKSPLFTTVLLCLLCLILGWVLGRITSIEETIIETVQAPEAVDPSVSVPRVIENAREAPEVIESSDYLNIDFSLGAADLLQRANEITDKAKRQLYLRTLLNHWITTDPYYSNKAREQFLAGIPPRPGIQNLGLETVFSHFVSFLSDNSIREAWKSNFSDHPSRSEIYSMFVGLDMMRSNPEELFENSVQWNPWERNRYNGHVLDQWAKKEPNRAYAWYLSNSSLFGTDAENSIFATWAERDFNELSAHLNTLLDAETRSRALDALAKQMAYKGTDEALDWANSLASTEDQDLAHDTIYRETPRGIGAVLKAEGGFPQVIQPLVSNGLQTGDLILSALNGDQLTEFYGKNLGNSVKVLLGTPGTDVTLQIMRPDPTTGQYRQVEITITRQQLWMEEEHTP